MRKIAALAAFLTIIAPLAALAQSHSPEDEAACTPDVLSLCQQYIPKRQEIIACLMREEAGTESRVLRRVLASRAGEKGRRAAPAAAQADQSDAAAI